MKPNIIPCPKKADVREKTQRIKPQYQSNGFFDCIQFLSDYCDRLFGLALTAGEEGLLFKQEEKLPAGSYKIEIAQRCEIFYADREGLLYAFATFLQLAQKTDDDFLAVPECTIFDQPDASWRGLMVDVARQWHPVAFLYQYADLCFLLKINKLQLHFTDDESFTLPCDAFPLLPTENRHYTKAELRALDEYAKTRGVTIVPEVDMPGHCTKFLEAYPEVFGSHGIMRATEETFAALENVYSSVMELFPDAPYIHVGGDEAIIGRWQDCEGSMQYMKDHGLADIVALYGHYVGRVTDFILSRGRTPVVWEGFHAESNEFISRKVIVIGWETYYQPAPELAKAGFTLINCSWKPLYIVSPWTKWEPEEILDWDIRMWTHWWEKSPAYNKEIRIPETAPVLGGQVCAWGDYIKKYASCQWAAREELQCICPRLAALSEKTWNRDGLHDKGSFTQAYGLFEEKLKKLAIL